MTTIGKMGLSPSDHLTVLDLASRWAKSPQAIHQMRWRGDLPVALKLGRRLVFRIADVEAFEDTKESINTSHRGGQ